MASLGLIHISDLHLGFRRFAFPRAQAHDDRVLAELFIALEEIYEENEFEHILVVSGDVSARGAKNELGFYATLRDNGVLWPGGQQWRAFRSGVTHVLDIPGNHDYWGDKVLNRKINKGARTYFPAPPWRCSRQVGNFSITLHGLCSTFGATGGDQRRAIGRFDQAEIADVASEIGKAAGVPQSYHWLVTHHSPSFCEPGRGSYLEPASHQQLVALCAGNPDIRGLLTGHVHARGIGNAQNSPLEALCSTTTQSHVFLDSGARRGFLYHEISDVDGTELQWKITPWEYTHHSFSATPPQTLVIA